MNKKMVKFKFDTWAAVTAVSKSLMQVLPSLSPTDKTLKGAGNHKLSLLGKASVVLTYGNKQIKDTVYVMDRLVNPLLGKPPVASLGVIGSIQEVAFNTSWVKTFPTLFQGVGSFGSKVKIALRKSSSAFQRFRE